LRSLSESKSGLLFIRKHANSNREIIDESDVFIDVHKAIRRMAPAPRARVPRGKVVTELPRQSSETQPLLEQDSQADREQNGATAPRKTSMPEMDDGRPKPSFVLRRRSSGSKGAMSPLRSDDPSVMQHLKHLGPSNVATRPKSTRINTVKIKPGQVVPDIPKTIPEDTQARSEPTEGVLAQESHAPEGGVGAGLLASAGREASDGAHSVAVGYGTMAPSGDRMSWKSGRSGPRDDDAMSPKGGAENTSSPFGHPTQEDNEETETIVVDNRKENNENNESRGRSHSVSTIASLHSVRSRSPPQKRHTARSGSISENVVDVNGIKKIVLETTSSSDSEDKAISSQTDGAEDQKQSDNESTNNGSKNANKKRRKKRGKKKKGGSDDSGESQPLLGDS
jgi:metal transporter CNNM